MKKINTKITIIKYGSNTLVCKNVAGEISIDYNNIQNHGLLINEIDNPVIIVSSGAVAFGKTLGNSFDYIKDEIIRKRIFAALGNPHLSIQWDKAISKKEVLQSLITHRDLTSENSKEKILEIICALFNHPKGSETVIQVNDNDFVTDEELVKIRGGNFGDNDKITALLAILCGQVFKEVEVVINTSSDGVLENNSVIPVLRADQLTDAYIDTICGTEKTNLGTGGMANKLKNIRDLVNNVEKAKVYIVNGKQPEQLKDVLGGKKNGTLISKKK